MQEALLRKRVLIVAEGQHISSCSYLVDRTKVLDGWVRQIWGYYSRSLDIYGRAGLVII